MQCINDKVYVSLFFIMVVLETVSLSAQQGDYLSPIPLSYLNTTSDDYAPYWSKELSTLFFTTEQGSKVRIVQVNRNENQWGEVKDYILPSTPLKGMISYFSLNDNIGYFSTFKMTSYRPQLSIFTTAREGENWSVPVELPAMASNYFTAQSTISPDGTTLVFVSDRPGSIGKTDLWITSRTPNGAWEQPLNLGEYINSVGNEITPFLVSEDSLFFASDGFGGKGGFDIYVTVRIGGIWQNPFPLSEINTEFNESDCIILPSGDIILASDRIGSKGGLDLFYIAKKTEETPLVTVEYALDIKPSMLTVEEYPVQDLIFLPKFIPIDVVSFIVDSVADGQQPVASPLSEVATPLAAFRSLPKILAKSTLLGQTEIAIRAVKVESDTNIQPIELQNVVRRFVESIKEVSPTARISVAPSVESKKEGFSGIELQYSADKTEHFVSENSSFMQAKSDSIEFFISARPVQSAKPVTLLLLSSVFDTLVVTTAEVFPFRTVIPATLVSNRGNNIYCKLINAEGEEIYGVELPIQYISLRQKETQGIKEVALSRFTVLHDQTKTIELPQTVMRALSRYSVKQINVCARDCPLAEQYSTLLQIRLQTVTKSAGSLTTSCRNFPFTGIVMMQVLTTQK